jgi:Family of unknown function (DUF6308)
MTSGFARDPAWFFEPKRRDKAVASLQYYFKSFTGSHFERIADHDNPNRITARDIVAVSMLGVDIPAAKSIWLLNEGADQVQALLRLVRPDQHIWDDDVDLTREGPLWRLWRLVRLSGWHDNVSGMRRTKTSKLLAAKRPHAVPIYDAFVAEALFGGEDPENYWNVWHERLTGAPGEELRAAVDHVRDEAGIGDDLSILRVIDVIVWMWEHDRKHK